MFTANSFFPKSLAIFMLVVVSCTNPVQENEQELDVGIPKQKITLNISGNNLYSFINVKLLSDSSRNFISQLGSYKFSTSIDPENSFDNRYNPNVNIYYEYEGLTLNYIGKGAGLVNRKDLQATLLEYSNSFYLDEIIIDPKLYKGVLPHHLSSQSKPVEVEKVLGKHNTFFDSGNNTTLVSYTYPEKGLYIVFNFYPNSVMNDSTIRTMTLRDSIQEMKRYPTLYPDKK